MNSLATPPHVSVSSTAVSRTLIAGIAFVVFTGFTLWVMSGHGVLGFLTLARDEPWALQMLLDLLVACTFGLAWVAGDARKRGIAFWPFVVATLTCGSIGLLAYAVRRGFTPRSGT